MPLTHEQRHERRRQMADEVAAGAEIIDVALKYGVCEATVRMAVKRPNRFASLRIRNEKRNAEMVKSVIEGEQPKCVAARFGVCTAVVYLALKEAKVKWKRIRKSYGGYIVTKEQIQAADWSKRDVDLSKEFGVSRERVRQIRIALGKDKSAHHKKFTKTIQLAKWVEENKANLAQLTANQIAAIAPWKTSMVGLESAFKIASFQPKELKPLRELITKETILQYVTVRDNGCWEWNGQLMPNGYGRVGSSKDEEPYAHRFTWQLFNGEIPGDMWCLHKCDKPSCVNPDHLYIGTPKDNAIDRVKRFPNCTHRLAPEQVAEIKQRYANGTPAVEMAAEYGFSFSAIMRAATRENDVKETAVSVARLAILERETPFCIRDIIDGSGATHQAVSCIVSQMVRDGTLRVVRPFQGKTNEPAIYELVSKMRLAQ